MFAIQRPFLISPAKNIVTTTPTTVTNHFDGSKAPVIKAAVVIAHNTVIAAQNTVWIAL